MRRLTDTEVADLLKGDTPLNVARRTFSTAAATLSAMENLTTMEMRRLEFGAVARIVAAFGVHVAPPGETAALRSDPEGHPRWRPEDGAARDPGGLAEWIAKAPEPPVESPARSPEDRAADVARLPPRPDPETAS